MNGRDPETNSPQRPQSDGRRRRYFLDHPENDLTADADFANRRPPAPRTAEEVASSTDPVLQADRNTMSTRQAFTWLFGTIIATVVVAYVLAWVARLMGGPVCDAGDALWLCSRSSQIWWPLVTSLVPAAGVIGCAIIMVRKLNSFTRWRPWMGVFWVLIPFAMMWMLQTWQIFIPALTD
ncbi:MULTISPECIES: hypothetical protein [Corynebacterium]|mgnify:FL=1|uniref:Uncharacterized protein n=3 Tax=Corynebacterium TaxID=1716 RepID=A0A0B6TZI9_9CORY|nr:MULTISPECIES: hypothetical protein [Corynebacterium]AJK70126.1 hypothetical protein B840_12790 [Corynebacterium marinum DSM 44953]MCS5480968.1 hypothetical protein [Corynebacterium lemuris]QGU05927.1 hypothetical protein CETAM_13510 [Corynebacterium comes]GGO22156.1 hypothetical protein GCM10010980_23950 [Corynebacterium marinum]